MADIYENILPRERGIELRRLNKERLAFLNQEGPARQARMGLNELSETTKSGNSTLTDNDPED